MAFASFNNGFVTAENIEFGVSKKAKISQLLQFPSITGRDAPGKTGNLAKPALISDLTLYLDEGPAKVRYVIWESNGTSPVFTSEYAPVSGADKLPILRSVFASTGYRVGFALAKSTSLSSGVAKASLTIFSTPTFNTTKWLDSVSSSWNFIANGFAYDRELATRSTTMSYLLRHST